LLCVEWIPREDIAANGVFLIDLQTQQFLESKLGLHDARLCVKGLCDVGSRREGALNRDSQHENQKGGPNQSPRHAQE